MHKRNRKTNNNECTKNNSNSEINRNKKLTLETVALVALGTVCNRKQDRKELKVEYQNNLARLGTVPNAETNRK